MLNLNKNKLIPAIEISTSWGEIKGDISKQTDLVELTTDLDTSIKGWVEGKGYLTEHQDLSSYALKTEIPSLTGYATQSWVQSQGYLTEHQDLSSYALKSEIPDVSGYVQETNLKTINGESLVGNGDIVIQTTAENIGCDPVSTDLFNFSNVNEGLIQITGSVEEINNTKENKKPVFYIDVNFEIPSIMTSYADYMSIGAQIKQLGVENVVLYVRDISGYICIPDVIETSSQNMMTITGMAYTNNYRIYNDSSSLFIYFNDFVSHTQLDNNINNVKVWVVNQKYAKKSEIPDVSGYIQGSNLMTINGMSIVGEGDLAIQIPYYIDIDIDSEEFMGTYDNYKALVDEYWNIYTSEAAKLIVGFQSPSTGVFGDSYPSYVYNSPEGKIEIGGYFLDERNENNKRLIYYRIKGNDVTQKVEVSFTPVSSGGDIPSLDGYATQSWVSSQGYLTSLSLTGYATESWVTNQGYITSIPDTFATKTWVSSQSYLTSLSLTGYATESWVSSQQFATQSWVSSQGYLTSHQDLTSYALKTEIPDVTDYATQTYVDNKIGQIDTLLDQMLG